MHTYTIYDQAMFGDYFVKLVNSVNLGMVNRMNVCIYLRELNRNLDFNATRKTHRSISFVT